jgi:hypothetical protein
MNTVSDKANRTRIVRMTLPCPVIQVGAAEIEFEVVQGPPILNEGAIDRIAPSLSAAEKDRLNDDIHHFAMTESFRRMIIIN